MSGARASSAERRPSLRARLLRAISVVSITLLAVCALSTAALTRLGGAIGLILRENFVSVVACQEMNEALERQDSAALFAATGRDDIARGLFETHRAGFAKALARENANITLPGESTLAREVSVLYADYLNAVAAVLARPSETRIDGYFRELLPRFHVLKAKIERIRKLNQDNMEWADREARRIATRTLEISALVTLLSLLLAAWLVRRLPRAVLEPLASFTAQARAIGEGRLSAKLAIPEVAELSLLAEALNRMQDKLRAYRESSLGELLAAKDLSRATISAMTDPVIVFGTGAEVELANEAAESIFGLVAGDADELRRAGVEVPEPIAIARDAVLARGEPILPESLSEAMRWITSDGERYFLVRASPLVRDDAKARSVIVVAQDVTRYRRIDALKSDVVATVSHELKTPLTSLRLATHMLLDEATGPLSGLSRELAETARSETERLQSTVDELLDLVRIEREAGAIAPTELDVKALFDEVVAAHQKIAEQRHIALQVSVPTELASVELDPEQVSILLGNLVSNAIRHSHEGGRVWLSAEEHGEELVLSVRDEGEGIAPEHLPRIFERRFSGADPATLKGRHGLGLAIAKEIAVRHGGTLDVRTELDKGSTFLLTLKRSHAPSVAHG